MSDDPRARDRSQPGDLSPIWRIVHSDLPDRDASAAPVVVALPAADRPWGEVAEANLRRLAESTHEVIFVVENRWARALLSLLAHRRWELKSAPSLRRVRRLISADESAQIVSAFVLWPSARMPRIAFPRGERRLVGWAQRSGVLGGGGNRLWARRLARSLLFRPIAMLISPAVALVVRRGGDA